MIIAILTQPLCRSAKCSPRSKSSRCVSRQVLSASVCTILGCGVQSHTHTGTHTQSKKDDEGAETLGQISKLWTQTISAQHDHEELCRSSIATMQQDVQLLLKLLHPLLSSFSEAARHGPANGSSLHSCVQVKLGSAGGSHLSSTGAMRECGV